MTIGTAAPGSDRFGTPEALHAVQKMTPVSYDAFS